MKTQLEASKRKFRIKRKFRLRSSGAFVICGRRLGKQALERRQCQVTRPHRRKINQLP